MHLQLALLLLDAKGDPDPLGLASHGPGAPPPSALQGQISSPDVRVLKGDKVQIEVSWSAENRASKCLAEEFVFNQEKRKTLPSGNWVYNGSLVMDGMFVGQRDGSIISLITDPIALINNVAPGHENDDIWTVNTNRMPAMNTPVQVTIKLKPSATSK